MRKFIKVSIAATIVATGLSAAMVSPAAAMPDWIGHGGSYAAGAAVGLTCLYFTGGVGAAFGCGALGGLAGGYVEGLLATGT